MAFARLASQLCGTHLLRVMHAGKPTVAVSYQANASSRKLLSLPSAPSLGSLLELPIEEIKDHIADAVKYNSEVPDSGVMCPIDEQTELWASGVTYKRSETARMEESGTPDVYSMVYNAERPELFMKANARRVVHPGNPFSIRKDSSWNVPEPELALVLNSRAETVGYSICNDASSRSIEGENPLYLPQAKVYAGCAALGPTVGLSFPIGSSGPAVEDPSDLSIQLRIKRGGGFVWEGETNTSEINRPFDNLISHLFREDEFPQGVVLSTGTGLVPDAPFTLLPDDEVHISIDGLGTLRNGVVQGKEALLRKNSI